jgi:hypothetical protein
LHACLLAPACSNDGSGGATQTDAAGVQAGSSAAAVDTAGGNGDAGAAGRAAGGQGGSSAPPRDAGAVDAGTDDSGMDGRVPDVPPGDDGGASDAGGGDPEVWSALSVMAVVNPLDHGAAGDGMADDLDALRDTIDALPASGGVVYLPAGSTFKKSDLLVVTKDHVKFWAANRGAGFLQVVAGQRRRQSLLCRDNTGCGFFGLSLRSDASARFDALEDNQISADRGSLVEVVGCEIDGSAATGVFLYGSTEHYIEGNFIHHTWADHVHHTDGARESWVWNNWMLNQAPSRGDDGVACVTYGPSSPRCGDMEWWGNVILHTDWGRGYSVIGGEDIHIHDNWAIAVAGAGIIVASEPAYDSASSTRITIERNVALRCGHAIGHPGILISGLNQAAEPLSSIALRGNVSAQTANAQPYRAEGAYANVTNMELGTDVNAIGMPVPGQANVEMADTTVLRTRDVSHADARHRQGLHRIHVRKEPAGDGFEQRLEYVLQGPRSTLDGFVAARVQAGAYLSEQRTIGDTSYALLLSAQPLELTDGLSGVTFRELRAGDRSSELGWLWQRLDSGNY